MILQLTLKYNNGTETFLVLEGKDAALFKKEMNSAGPDLFGGHLHIGDKYYNLGNVDVLQIVEEKQ